MWSLLWRGCFVPVCSGQRPPGHRTHLSAARALRGDGGGKVRFFLTEQLSLGGRRGLAPELAGERRGFKFTLAQWPHLPSASAPGILEQAGPRVVVPVGVAGGPEASMLFVLGGSQR